MSALVLNERGEPTPPSAVVAALQAIDRALGVRWVAFPTPYWAIVEHWREDHPKRVLVRDGSVAPEMAFDLVAQLPPHFSVDEAVGFVERFVRRTGDAGQDARALVEQSQRARDGARQIEKERVLAEARDEGERTTARDLALELGRTTAAAMVTVPALPAPRPAGAGKKAARTKA